mgnify:CR=1 FL=1
MKFITPTKSSMVKTIGQLIGVKQVCRCCSDKTVNAILQLQNQTEITCANDLRGLEVKKQLAIKRN